MRTLGQFLMIFLALVGTATLLMNFSDFQFGSENFWNHHGLFFLIFISFFPRLTLLFSSVASGGLLWWLSFFFAPRLLVAVLATFSYWQTNPVLVMISWFVAISGESGEKYVVTRRVRYGPPIRTVFTSTRTTTSASTGPVIDAEYKRVDD